MADKYFDSSVPDPGAGGTSSSSTSFAHPIIDELRELPLLPVEGFEQIPLQVRVFRKSVPKSQSWCYVPLIASAMRGLHGFPHRFKGGGVDGNGNVGADADEQCNSSAGGRGGTDTTVAGAQRYSTPADIANAQHFWRAMFSRWDVWVADLRRGLLRRFGESDLEASCINCKIFANVRNGPKTWTCSLVLTKPRDFGVLPHPPARAQEVLLEECLDPGLMCEIYASIGFIAAQRLLNGAAEAPAGMDEFGFGGAPSGGKAKGSRGAGKAAKGGGGKGRGGGGTKRGGNISSGAADRTVENAVEITGLNSEEGDT